MRLARRFFNGEMPGFHPSFCLIKKLQSLTVGRRLPEVTWAFFLHLCWISHGPPSHWGPWGTWHCRGKLQACSWKHFLIFFLIIWELETELQSLGSIWVKMRLAGSLEIIGEERRECGEEIKWEYVVKERCWGYRGGWVKKEALDVVPRILTMEPGMVAHGDNVNVWCGGKTIIVRDQKMEQRFPIREFL